MRQEIEYHQHETNIGKIAGLVLTFLLLIVTMACHSQSSVITEDFSDYQPAPEMVATPQTTSQQPIMSQQQPRQSQEVPRKNVNPVQSEVKQELTRTGKTILGLVIGILGTAIIVNTTNLTNGITTDYH